MFYGMIFIVMRLFYHMHFPEYANSTLVRRRLLSVFWKLAYHRNTHYNKLYIKNYYKVSITQIDRELPSFFALPFSP